MLNKTIDFNCEELEQVKNIWEMKMDINMEIAYNVGYRNNKTKSEYRKVKHLIRLKSRALNKIMKNLAK